MKADPILQEIWDIKDRLPAEAGYDVDRFVDQIQEWTAKHPPPARWFATPSNCGNSSPRRNVSAPGSQR